METGSIGLDAKAFCAKCGQPIDIDAEGNMNRTCHDLDAGVNLKDVETKEYSYVAEPAFSHSIAVPSFSAAVDELAAKFRASSLSHSGAPKPIMSTVEATAAKKADADAKVFSQSEADAYADAKMALYRKGYADALADAGKFRAEGEGKSEADASAAKADAEGEGKSEADAGKGFAPSKAEASAKTDQIGRVPILTAPAGVDRNELLARVLRPTSTALGREAWIKELWTAAAEHPRAPAEFKAMVKRAYT